MYLILALSLYLILALGLYLIMVLGLYLILAFSLGLGLVPLLGRSLFGRLVHGQVPVLGLDLIQAVHGVELRLIVSGGVLPGIEGVIHTDTLGVKPVQGVVPLLLGGGTLVLIGKCLPLPGAVGVFIDGVAHKGIRALGSVGTEALRMDKDLVSRVLGGRPSVFHLLVAAPVQVPVLGLQVFQIAGAMEAATDEMAAVIGGTAVLSAHGALVGQVTLAGFISQNALGEFAVDSLDILVISRRVALEQSGVVESLVESVIVVGLLHLRAVEGLGLDWIDRFCAGPGADLRARRPFLAGQAILSAGLGPAEHSVVILAGNVLGSPGAGGVVLQAPVVIQLCQIAVEALVAAAWTQVVVGQALAHGGVQVSGAVDRLQPVPVDGKACQIAVECGGIILPVHGGRHGGVRVIAWRLLQVGGQPCGVILASAGKMAAGGGLIGEVSAQGGVPVGGELLTGFQYSVLVLTDRHIDAVILNGHVFQTIDA